MKTGMKKLLPSTEMRSSSGPVWSPTMSRRHRPAMNAPSATSTSKSAASAMSPVSSSMIVRMVPWVSRCSPVRMNQSMTRW